ncbi:MAG: hypothetical protein H7831_10500 [Magnetococcus sp. WYHC-3]
MSSPAADLRVDTHCHILPGIDDGPATWAESLDMARLAQADGTSVLFATPHFIPNLWANRAEAIAPLARELSERMQAAGLTLQLRWAAELRVSPEVMDLVRRGGVPRLGVRDGEDVILLEFPHNGIPPGSDKFVAWLRRQNILPVLAHPERNPGFWGEGVARLATYLDMGCLTQVTAASLTGEFGDPSRDAAREILERGWGHILASDGHGVTSRPPLLQAGLVLAQQWIGVARAQALVSGLGGVLR